MKLRARTVTLANAAVVHSSALATSRACDTPTANGKVILAVNNRSPPASAPNTTWSQRNFDLRAIEAQMKMAQARKKRRNGV